MKISMSADFLVFHELQTKRAQSGPGIEYKDAVAAANLDARRIAAIANRRRAGSMAMLPRTPQNRTRIEVFGIHLPEMYTASFIGNG